MGEKEEEQNDVDMFGNLMAEIGTRGRFQKRFNLVFNMGFVCLFAMPCFNILLALSVPDHWCHVPGRTQTNFTLHEWKEMTIPRKEEGDVVTFSKCEMYAGNSTNNIVGCEHGWEFDTTWYSMTVPSQESWVCDKKLYVTNAIFCTRVGEAVGSLILGQLADTIGRRPVMMVSVFLLTVGRCLSVFTSSMYFLFIAACMIGNSPALSVFMSPLIIGVEVSSPKDRSHMAMLQCIGWTLGISIVPFIAWSTGGDWRYLLIISSVPCLAMYFFHSWFPESPRWLAARGRFEECEKVLRHICKVNGTELSEEALGMLSKLEDKKEDTFGIASLFSSWRFAKNSCLVFSTIVLCHLIYYALIILVTQMSGNPFLNFFLQGFMELPGMVMGRITSDKLGRRWSQALAYSLAGISCLIISFIVCRQDLQWLQTSLVVLAKFSIAICVYASYLLNTELYPACVRQTGSSVGFVASSLFGVLSPYIAYMGTAIDMRYPYILLSILAVLGIISCLCLPETLNTKVPETLAEAAVFGKDQKFWSFPATKRQEIDKLSEAVKD